ncbi:hypothetical protein Gohar_017454, partial [Gossypium harknessii]|nr:hypothetical protein [Gossypium harknessii]
HFIDDNWEPKIKILVCKTLEHIYGTKALSKIIQGLVLEWNISKKVFSITMDNSYLNDDTFQKIKETCLSDQGSFPSNHWFISCTLIEDGFRDMDLEKIDGNFKLNPSVEEWEMSNYPTIILMKRKFDYYRTLCNSAFVVATILDLRLKFKFLELSYTEIYSHDSKMHLNKFHKVFTNVYYEYANEARNLFKSASDLDDSNSSKIEIANDCILDSFSKFASARKFNEVASWKSELDFTSLGWSLYFPWMEPLTYFTAGVLIQKGFLH